MVNMHDIRALLGEDLLERSRDPSRPRLLPMIKVQVSSREGVYTHAALFCPDRASHAVLSSRQGACDNDHLTAGAH
jgi:hypothetical protein